jgi:thiol-disulfide isomerase/thioredoxin
MGKIFQAILATFFWANLAFATSQSEIQPFQQSRFDALQQQGKPVLVWIHADWCPTCRAQGKVLDELLPMPDLKGLTVLRVDFDSQKPLVQSFRAQRQSTFILFKGGKEIGRSLGDTRRDSILALLKQAT